MRLTLVAWNCAGGLARKSEHLRALKPDIAIISEAHASTEIAESTSKLWRGRLEHSGVLIAAFNGWMLEEAQIDDLPEIFLPCVARKEGHTLNIVGACVKKAKTYAEPALFAIERLSGFLSEGPCILGGDFNQSSAIDRTRRSKRTFSEVSDRLLNLDMRSAWHSHRNEDFGRESSPTFFWRWKSDATHQFHIDYVFASNDLTLDGLQIGTFDAYVRTGISDHVPLRAEYLL